MKKVIFICRGNMFRSQLAKAFYNQLKTDGSVAYAYGTKVKEEGRQGVKLSFYRELEAAIDEMRGYDLDISGEVCEQLLPEHLVGAEKIIVMAEDDCIPEWLREYSYEKWNIRNPSFVTPELAKETAKIIKEKVLTLLNSGS